MDIELLNALISCETDVEGSLRRFSGDESFYSSCVNIFLDDPTMTSLEYAIKKQDWDEAFTAAHALKGLAGNLGFIPLFHETAELVVLIRAGRVRETDDAMRRIKLCYRELVSAIGAVQKRAGGTPA